jgi:hypothetical protein
LLLLLLPLMLLSGLCDPAVWAEVERQMTSSGIQGLNSGTLNTFTRMCGIPNAGAGTC